MDLRVRTPVYLYTTSGIRAHFSDQTEPGSELSLLPPFLDKCNCIGLLLGDDLSIHEEPDTSRIQVSQDVLSLLFVQ